MNKFERMKNEKDGLDVFPALMRAAEVGWESLDDDDLMRLKWYGLYAHNTKDGHFMLRTKVVSAKAARPKGPGSAIGLGTNCRRSGAMAPSARSKRRSERAVCASMRSPLGFEVLISCLPVTTVLLRRDCRRSNRPA